MGVSGRENLGLSGSKRRKREVWGGIGGFREGKSGVFGQQAKKGLSVGGGFGGFRAASEEKGVCGGEFGVSGRENMGFSGSK